MPSTQDHTTPITLTQEPEQLVESRQGSLGEPDERPSTEPPASQVLDQPPQTPLKDRGSGGRLTGNPSLPTDSPTTHTTTLRDSTPQGFSQVLEFNRVSQTTLTAAAELITGNANRPDEAPMSNMTNAGSPVNQPTATGHDRSGNNTNPDASGSTPTITSARPNTATSSGTSGSVANTIHYHLDRSQTLLSSRPLSPERPQSGHGLATYDPIRGEIPIQDPVRRTSVPRPRPAFNPTDGTLVGSGYGPGPGSRRASRLMSGQDWLPDVPVIQEPLPPVSGFSFHSSMEH